MTALLKLLTNHELDLIERRIHKEIGGGVWDWETLYASYPELHDVLKAIHVEYERRNLK